MADDHAGNPPDDELAPKLEEALFEIRRVIAGQEGMLERVLVCLLSGGHLLLEGVPGLAKTLTIKTAAAVHAGPRPVGPDRHAHLPTRQGGVRHRARPGVLQLPARGRDQPRAREGAVGAARGDAGAAGDDRPPHLPGARAVPRARDAEPDRVRGDVSAPGGADRPLHAQGARRLPGARRGADRRAAVARGSRHAGAGPAPRPAAGPPAARARGVRRPVADRLLSDARRGDSAAARPRRRRHRPVRDVRREPARADLARERRPRAGAPPRPRLRHRRRPARARSRRVPAPPRALVPGARRGGRARPDPRRRARQGARAAARSRAQGDGGCMRGLLGDAVAPERSPSRPGPGPLSASSLRSLELAIGRRVDGLLAGDYRSAFPGIGSELYQVRQYEPGDDVRRIEWNVTARTGRPHVRVELAERVLVTWLVLDASASMAFGTADRRKADVAEGVALAVGYAATRRGNRLGLVTFGAEDPRLRRPRQGRAALLDTLQALRDEDPTGSGGLAAALALVDRVAVQRALVVVVSDFRGGRDWRVPLLRVAARHPTLAVEVRDPREQELADVGELRLVDPETGRQLRVDTRDRKLRERFAAAAADERRSLVTLLTAAGVRHVALSTAGDWLRPLASFLRRSARAR